MAEVNTKFIEKDLDKLVDLIYDDIETRDTKISDDIALDIFASYFDSFIGATLERKGFTTSEVTKIYKKMASY